MEHSYFFRVLEGRKFIHKYLQFQLCFGGLFAHMACKNSPTFGFNIMITVKSCLQYNKLAKSQNLSIAAKQSQLSFEGSESMNVVIDEE